MYGAQTQYDEERKAKIMPIEEEISVDKRRAGGLELLQEYLDQFRWLLPIRNMTTNFRV